MKNLYIKITTRLSENEWLAQLFVRISIGIFFVLSATGDSKLGNLDAFVAHFEHLGVPFASIQAPIVAVAELLCGALLVVGLASRVCAGVLSGIMIVAMLTEAIDLQYQRYSESLVNFLYLSEWLILLILFWLIFAGPGRASIDWGLSQRLRED